MIGMAAIRSSFAGLMAIVLPATIAGTLPAGEDKETIEARISQVMEIYPPRLTVLVKKERYTIYLSEKTSITKDGKKLDFGDLRTDQLVKIEGIRKDKAKPLHLDATEVKVIK